MANAAMHLVVHAFDEHRIGWLALIVGVVLVVGILAMVQGILMIAGGAGFTESLAVTDPNMAP